MKKPPSFKYEVPASQHSPTHAWKKRAFVMASALLMAANSFAVISGNFYDIGGSASAGVSPTAAQWVTFTASEDAIVSEAQLYANNLSGSPVLEVGLYAVNGSGVPTGSALSSGTVTATAAGWVASTLSYSLVKGTVYALRVSTSTVGTTYNWRLNSSPGGNTIQPVGVADSHWFRGINTSAPVGTGQNVWILKTGTNQAIGQPYTAAGSQNIGSTGVAFGQRFRFDLPTTGENLLESVGLKLNVSATPPANPLVVRLLDKNGLVLTSGSIDLSATAPGVAYFNISLASAQQLTAGEFYYLAVVVNSTVANSVTWLNGSTINDPLYQSATYQGTDAYAVTWNSQSTFGTPATTDLSRDYSFQLNLTAVPEPSTWALLGMGLMAWTFVRRQRSAWDNGARYSRPSLRSR
jgi:hypothetical protein